MLQSESGVRCVRPRGRSLRLNRDTAPATPSAAPKSLHKAEPRGRAPDRGLHPQVAPNRTAMPCREAFGGPWHVRGVPERAILPPARRCPPDARAADRRGTHMSSPGEKGGGQKPCGSRCEGAKRCSSPPLTPLQPRRRRCGSEPSSSPSSSSSGAGKVTLACSLHFLTLVDIAPAAVRAWGCRPPPPPQPPPGLYAVPLPNRPPLRQPRAAPGGKAGGENCAARHQAVRGGNQSRVAAAAHHETVGAAAAAVAARRKPGAEWGARAGKGSPARRLRRWRRRRRLLGARLLSPTASLARTLPLLRVKDREGGSGGGGGRQGGRINSLSDRASWRGNQTSR